MTINAAHCYDVVTIHIANHCRETLRHGTIIIYTVSQKNGPLSIFAIVVGIVLIWKWLFVTTVISQGSVATRLRCGGQCDSHFVANFLMNSTMEKFRKSVNICRSYGQKYRGPFFYSQCIMLLHISFKNNHLSPRILIPKMGTIKH